MYGFAIYTIVKIIASIVTTYVLAYSMINKGKEYGLEYKKTKSGIVKNTITLIKMIILSAIPLLGEIRYIMFIIGIVGISVMDKDYFIEKFGGQKIFVQKDNKDFVKAVHDNIGDLD